LQHDEASRSAIGIPELSKIIQSRTQLRNPNCTSARLIVLQIILFTLFTIRQNAIASQSDDGYLNIERAAV